MPNSINLNINSKHCLKAMMILWAYDLLKLFLGFSLMQEYGINPYVFFFLDVVTVPPYILGMARLINSLTEHTRRSDSIFLWTAVTAAATVIPYVYAVWAGGRAFPLQGWIILLFIMVFPIVDLIRRTVSRKKTVVSEQRLQSAGEKLVISQSNSDELRRLDVGSWKSVEYKNERVPFLEEVIATIPERGKLIVEIKCGPEILPVIHQIVSNSTKKDQLIFIGFGWETISAAKNMFPNHLCYWLSEDKAGLSEKIRDCADNGIDGVDLYYKIIDSEIIEHVHKSGLEVLCWTVDDPVKARQLIDLGVTGITTNRPAWLQSNVTQGVFMG